MAGERAHLGKTLLRLEVAGLGRALPTAGCCGRDSETPCSCFRCSTSSLLTSLLFSTNWSVKGLCHTVNKSSLCDSSKSTYAINY